MTKSIELERTYLLRRLPDELNSATPKHMVDVYIPDHGVDHPHIRIRAKDDTYVITKKYPVHEGDTTQQVENTIPLNKNEYDALKITSKAIVEKLRYNIDIDGFPAEVDVFQGALKGLAMVDFEFKDYDHLKTFKMPDVALCEVSNVGFLAGGLLAGKSYDDIAEQLSSLGYARID